MFSTRLSKFSIFFFALFFLLTSHAAQYIEDYSQTTKIQLTEIIVLGGATPIPWNFSNCGKSSDSLIMKSVSISTTPVRSLEFTINMVLNAFLL